MDGINVPMEAQGVSAPASHLSIFTIAISGVSLAYSILVWLWRLATLDSDFRDTEIFKTSSVAGIRCCGGKRLFHATLGTVLINITRRLLRTLNHPQFIFSMVGILNIAWLMAKYEDLMSMTDIYFGILSALAAASAYRTYTNHVKGFAPRVVDMRGKVVIVTGSNTGIGYETAKSLVNCGAHVIMACRSDEKAKAAMAGIKEELELVAKAIRNSTAPAVRGKMEFMKIDLSSLASVREFVDTFRASKLDLDVLILNAGVMFNVREGGTQMVPQPRTKRTVTMDGFETTLAVNYLANVLLVSLLLPKIKASKDGRIIFVSSGLHFNAKKFNFEDPMYEKGYSLFRSYSHSKLALLMYAQELQKRLFNEGCQVIVNSVSPGTVMTEISRNMNIFMRAGNAAFKPLLALFSKQPDAGAYGIVYAATTQLLRRGPDGKPLSIGGLYLVDSAPKQYNQAADVEVSRKKLWNLTEELIGRANKKLK